MKKLARKVEKEYGLTVRSHQVLRNTPNSLVVLFRTPGGSWIGKSLFISAERQRFILKAEEYLRSKHIAIPSTRRTLQHERFIQWKGHPFVLQQQVAGKLHDLSTAKGVRMAAACLGKMHAASLGFECQSSPLYNGAVSWDREYQTDLLSLRNWMHIHANTKRRKLSLILRSLPYFYSAGKTVQAHAKQSAYFAEWKKLPPSRHFLCHGDFHPGNLIVHRGKMTVIDWEDVRHDFPSKDITRLLFTTMRRQKTWSARAFSVLLRSYLRHNPLTSEQLQLLFQDLAFPHIVERFIRRQDYEWMTVKQVRQFLHREKLKTRYMLNQLKAHA